MNIGGKTCPTAFGLKSMRAAHYGRAKRHGSNAKLDMPYLR